MTWYAHKDIGFVQDKGIITGMGLTAQEYTNEEKDALFGPGCGDGVERRGAACKSDAAGARFA